MKTYALTPKDIEPRWHVVDADGQTLGRLASSVAATLRGKGRPTFTPSMSSGDYVVVVNAARVRVTGDKREKVYRRHSMYPGGLKEITQEKLLQTRPERVVEFAVKGMLPKNSHGARLLRRLKVYAGADHPHQGQTNAGRRESTAEVPPPQQADE